MLGQFIGSGVAKLGMRDVTHVSNLLLEILDELEAIAKDKGGVAQLL